MLFGRVAEGVWRVRVFDRFPSPGVCHRFTRRFPGFPAFEEKKQDQKESDDQKIHECPEHPLESYIPFMSGHDIGIIPVLRNSTGTHFLTP